MTSKPDADARLVEAHDLALSALREITPAATIGPAAGYIPEEDGSVSLRFENRLPGYPGWYWTVTVARVEDEEPTVLEVELLPGDGALLAPEWVPWAERLAEYRAHQAELAEAAAAGGDDEADTDDEDADGELDDDGIDDDELDEDGSDILHAGDLDGVDIDELDDSEDDASDEDDEAEDDDAEDDEADGSEDDDADARDADVGDEEE
ncbi:DUF3027 domain-containing protein [Microbacterium sp. CH1]|uniref:DUF3027 domain-containing protein n=1 Tax=Microbacterium sp. CH1 TaxID=1770208 RepID=UPI0007886CB0|nr:DUF3027 domain-containing protein [Microbacterium sp. CH1]KYJ97600.1 DNA primase [Microbacterium sp. CH1]